MIEINLLPSQRKKKARAGLSLPSFGEAFKTVRDPLLIGAVAAWLLVLGAIAFVFVTEQGKIRSLQQDLTRVEAEHRRFQAVIADKRRTERLRDSLLVELRSIRRIDADRYVWPHIMEEVTKAVPDFTWLVGVAAIASPPPADPDDSVTTPPVRFQIEGRTADIAAYTRFLRQLGESPWIANVVPGATQTVVEEAKPVTSFTIQATYRAADSAYIRTVPVAESVR